MYTTVTVLHHSFGNITFAYAIATRHVRIQRGGQGVLTPLENHKNIAFLSNIGPDPLKNHNATKAAFIFWAIIGPPAKRHLNGVSLAGR